MSNSRVIALIVDHMIRNPSCNRDRNLGSSVSQVLCAIDGADSIKIRMQGLPAQAGPLFKILIALIGGMAEW